MPTPTVQTTTVSPAPIKSTPKRSWLSVGFEFIILAVAAVFFLEWFLGVCGVGQQEFLEPDTEIGCHHLAGKQVVWRMEGYSNDYLNSKGLRDVEHALVKPAGITRIALLGDSATEGLQVPLSNTFARVLDKQLNGKGNDKFEVINFGCSSYSTGQQLLQLQKDVLAYQPDVVALLYVRGSTLDNVRDPSKPKAEPRPYFYLDQSGNLQVDRSMIPSAIRDPNSIINFLRRNSRIYGVLTQTDLALSIHEKPYRKLRGFVLSLVTPKTKPAMLPPYQKQDGFKVTEAIISKINNECRQHRIRFVLMFFPNTVRDLKYEQELVSLYKLSKKEGFGYLDLTEPFQKHPDGMSLFLQYHFSSAGHKMVADQLQVFLYP